MKNKIVIVDGHSDFVERALDKNWNCDNEKLQFCIKKLENKLPYIQMGAAFVHSKYQKNNSGFERAIKILDKLYIDQKENIIKSWNDIEEVIKNRKIGIIPTIENGAGISGDLNNIKEFIKRNVKMMSITWNDDNELGTGAFGIDKKNGLTELGKKYVNILQKNNIIVDVSHCSEKTFWDVMKQNRKIVVASHSCVNRICDTKRNLKDEQIKELAKQGGIIGICFYRKFLSNKNNVTIEDIVKHIEYIVDLAGIDYVGIGSDFDGIEDNELPDGIKGAKDIEKIWNLLIKKGYSKTDISKISGGNWLRILKQYF